MDAIAPKRESAQREMERRIVAQLLTCLDDLAAVACPASASEGDESAMTQHSQELEETPAQPRHVVVIGEHLLLIFC